MNRHQQEAKKYLSQAFGLNQRIESKLGQIEDLHNLATKATVTYSDTPRNPNKGQSRLEDCVIQIMELEAEINRDMIRLVELKKDIIRRIKAVENAELQTILELRYLSYMRWEEIAIELGYGIDNVFRLHRNALDEITIPEIIQ
jgi:DNA-directed RNA polymerase specialized sigma subunit